MGAAAILVLAGSRVLPCALLSRHSGQAGRSDFSWCVFGIEGRLEKARGD
jgi:hypothetical protein